MKIFTKLAANPTRGNLHTLRKAKLAVSAERKPIRLGAVSYLNTRPLVHGLESRRPGIDLMFDLPSRLADRLAAGDLDVALIPSVEYFQNPAYRIVSDACIGCRGPVLSVKLLSRVPLAQIGSLALDEGSRTSVALTRILLKHKFGLSPRLEALPIGSGVEATSADAILLIGDRAIHPPTEGFIHEWDLGDQWCRWSELSFVFAMWVARPGAVVDGLAEALEASRDSGVANLADIARREAPRVGLKEDECLSYLQDNLYFYLGPRERQGLAQFHRYAAQFDLVPA